MSIFFDLIIVAVIVISIINGWRNGLVKSVMSFASAILAFFAAVFFTPALGSFICDHFIEEPISAEIAETLSSLLATADEKTSYTTSELFEDMPAPLTKILERYNVDKSEFIEKFKSDVPATDTLVHEMSDAIARPVAGTVSGAAAFIIIFVVVSVILKIVTIVIGAVFELPALKQLNEVFGLLFGVFGALFYAVVLSNAFVHLSSALAVFDPSMFSGDIIEKTYLVRLFSGFELSMLTNIMSEIKSAGR